MRDRLIEVLGKTIAVKDEDTDDYIEWLADELIANGVIVLPCKIGDTLYDIMEFLDGTSHPEMYELRGVDMMIEKITDNTYVFSYDGCYMNHDDIGKSLFFTREDAEKALKECKGK